MFSFLGKPQVGVGSITVPDFGWQKVRDHKSVVQWTNPERTVAVSVNFFDVPPDIPATTDARELRLFYREMVRAANGGILKAELGTLAGKQVVETLFKTPQEPNGMTYFASLTFPFKTCSFVVKVQAVEDGPTGMREAIIANEFLASGADMKDWAADPYDPDFRKGVLMNWSEYPRYDERFPLHPLSQARKLIKVIAEGITWGKEIDTLEPFL